MKPRYRQFQARRILRKRMQRSHQRLLDDVQARAKRNASGGLVRRRTGRLAASIRQIRSRRAAGRFGGRILATARHAAPVEKGRREFTLRPRNKKVLRFRSGGLLIFASSSRVGASKARPVVGLAARRGVAAHKRQAARDAKQAVREVVRAMKR